MITRFPCPDARVRPDRLVATDAGDGYLSRRTGWAMRIPFTRTVIGVLGRAHLIDRSPACCSHCPLRDRP